jgi:HEAT repeat protein
VKALGEIGDPRATDALVSLLISSENQGYEERDALIKIGGKKAIKKLKRVAKNKTNKNAVRYHAIQVLGEIGDRSVVSTLARIAKEPVAKNHPWGGSDHGVGGVAQRALEKVNSRLQTSVPQKKWWEFWKK